MITPKPKWRAGIYYSDDPKNWCRDCLRDFWNCLNFRAAAGERMCGKCRVLKDVSLFSCTQYWCRPCFREYQQMRRAGETYAIECSYCGEPITKAPFCNESCRKKFELAVLESIKPVIHNPVPLPMPIVRRPIRLTRNLFTEENYRSKAKDSIDRLSARAEPRTVRAPSALPSVL